MSGLPQTNDPRLLVGSATADDAGVYKLDDERALVQTLDFFTPITDDPYLFGQIAAANSLSDVYAMGGRPLTAMAIAGMPTNLLSNDEIADIFRGGADKVKEAACSLVGGHTIKNPEPIYGLSVTGIVHPNKYLANAHCKVGDYLILTKPIGTGIIATASKQGQASERLDKLATTAMVTLNTAGAELSEKNLINGCTDITGFGLLGHLAEMCRGSKVSAALNHTKIPHLSEEVIHLIENDFVPGGSRKNLQNIESSVEFAQTVSEAHKILFADAQTSGGLLLSVAAENIDQTLDILSKHHSMCAANIGQIVEKRAHDIYCS